ncbi:carboxylate-amine ligase [Muriicola jejuensis]|jgi:carboxylate-amine ligase|uniref:Putative glutamate--cysteine ligase 2 n=1 Tax=Muriicola jejuensis TaxID=504488 RepID=A0A6P0UDS7_9FLAO|nr:carboxylate-amine ligase [Muriicola jejuensis]NER10069.1 carboxylate-amine ligase [Muriicola jejuensis]SMP03262.1 carboxylate-amine ligase [Muriicola jejuensis]
MKKFTLGIEEEFQILDSETYTLRSHMSKILEGGKVFLKERIKEEMHQAVIEMGTNICENINQARDEVSYLRQQVIELAAKEGLKVGAAGTHPFSNWSDQPITPNPRYDELIAEMKDVARSNLIFGLHVHVGIPSREEGLQIMNIARYFLPHLYALSTNSPFWEGRDTGFKSFRSKIFDKFPRTGIPPYFASVGEYDKFVEVLVKTNCIDNGKKIWWDIRLHPFYPTVEFRVCDMVMTVDEVTCIAALMQCIIAKLHKLHQKNQSFRSYRRVLINENKWRAARWGIEAKLIDFGKEEEVPFKTLINELLDFVEDVVDELGCRTEVNYVYQMLEQGSGADRQLKVFNETNDLKEVVKYIVEETGKGL